ncbi:hypothetical protein [Polyangium mundeleinium]|uniref:Peptidase M43 pregnancy-associated plasma-A domain-containing protein n=1 Tax=Polyangium mundeleinium TaxID=2995306 RepID=A0ABT5F7E0_9BACT|nr:hypothetical protein [Polyangium mundeleinium]MDC0750028.1 hypothetical protein [Polyangium mundeleinium]
MSPCAAFAGVALAALLAGCSSHAPEAPDAVVSAWVEAFTTAFQSDGETEDVVIPAQAPCAGIALRATTAPDVCFQLSSAVDGEGRVGVDGLRAGAFCRDCELRASVAATAGVFLLPAEAGRFEPETGLSLRFARVDCVTLTPLAAPDDRPTLRVAAQRIEAIPDQATIDLRFLVTKSSILSGDEDRQEALIAHLGQELASGGLLPRLVEVHALDVLPADVRFHAGDPAALSALIADAPPRAETTVDVVFGGCLLYDDPIFGPPSAVHGYTPRIPGGAGPADAVFMPGLDCFAGGSGPLDVPVRAQAHFLAHELGHYLGLYHAVEEDGLTDLLDDTGPDNVMHSHPAQATAVGFSPSQGRSMRMHPTARPR